jgi:hypothetical protein
LPVWLQCQTYTAWPASGSQVAALTSVRVSRNTSPAAVPDAEPTLDRRSLRSIPAIVSAFGPLVPSPGYGPAVSVGITEQVAALLPESVLSAPASGDGVPPCVQALASGASARPAAALAIIPNILRRDMVWRSRTRPPNSSWSC